MEKICCAHCSNKTPENILKKASKPTSAMETRCKISKRKYEIAVKLIVKSNNRKGRKTIVKHVVAEKAYHKN